MAKYTAIGRCSGANHVHATIQTDTGLLNRTYEMSELIDTEPPHTEEYIRERVRLHVREAMAAGNSTYAQIRTYLLALPEWVE